MKRSFLLVILTIVSFSVLAKDKSDKLRDNLFRNPKYVTVVAHRGDWTEWPQEMLDDNGSMPSK